MWAKSGELTVENDSNNSVLCGSGWCTLVFLPFVACVLGDLTHISLCSTVCVTDNIESATNFIRQYSMHTHI